jgi:hypothetical protein
MNVDPRARRASAAALVCGYPERRASALIRGSARIARVSACRVISHGVLPSQSRIRETGASVRSAGGGSNGHPDALAIGYSGIVVPALLVIAALPSVYITFLYKLPIEIGWTVGQLPSPRRTAR